MAKKEKPAGKPAPEEEKKAPGEETAPETGPEEPEKTPPEESDAAPENGEKKAPEEKKDPLAEEHERFLRLAAEYDNYRKRTQKEKDRMYADAVERTVVAILPTLDNLERAVDAAEDREGSFFKGVEMTLKMFREQLSKMDVNAMDTKEGTPFDPNYHEAIMHEDDGSGHNVVAETFQKGYLRKDTVIRPALVKTRG
ncbi:MAG: nucleotide exchange factor GrpE [Clostridia bacterium]|nr:nucleotide exchange factor GrpE [Clostridia bacterium]